MTHSEKRLYLIKELLSEQPQYERIEIPDNTEEQKRILRSLIHSCVDNIIHSVSGIQLRLACDKLMTEQGYDEPTGKAKITPAFNHAARITYPSA